jgi:hypothetical protein
MKNVKLPPCSKQPVNRGRTGNGKVLDKEEASKILVELKRNRNGGHQTLETLINEEAQLFAKYLRGEVKTWVPRVPEK